MHSGVPALSIISAVAYLLFTVAGALLWRRTKSVPSVMIATGFAIVLLDQVMLLANYAQLNNSLTAHSGDTLFIIYHRANSPGVVLVGTWLAALGLIWHASKVSRH